MLKLRALHQFPTRRTLGGVRGRILRQGKDGLTGGRGIAMGGEGGGAATTTVGVCSAVTPSSADAVAAVGRREESEDWTASAVVEGGTAMVAVMTTLPGLTSMLTHSESTPASRATLVRIAVVFW